MLERLDALTEAVDDKVAKAGDDMSGTLNMKKPRDGTLSNSFVVYGNKDGSEEQPILIDFRKPLSDDTDTEFRYYGLIEDDNALVNKKWIEGNMLKIDGSNATDPIVFPGIVQCADPVDGSDAVTLDYLQSKLPGTSSYISWSRAKTTDRRPRLDVLKGIENYRKILIKQWFYDEDYRPAWGFKMTDGVFWRPNLSDNDQGNLHEQRGQDDESMTIVSYTSTDSFGTGFFKENSYLRSFNNAHYAKSYTCVYWEFEIMKGSRYGPDAGFSFKVNCTITNQSDGQSVSTRTLETHKDGNLNKLGYLFLDAPDVAGAGSYGNAIITESF